MREAGQWFLRLYLDKDGGVDILDCENVSRKVSDLLDEIDPIEGSYIFEVSSAGAERQLKRPSDFEKFMGSPVLLKTYQNRDGRKEFAGVLKGYDGGAVVLEMGTQELRFEKNEILHGIEVGLLYEPLYLELLPVLTLLCQSFGKEAVVGPFFVYCIR